MKKLFVYLPLVFALHCAEAVTIYEPFADASASGGTAYPPGTTFANTNKSFPALENATGGPWYGVSNTFPSLPAGIPTITNDNLSFPGLPASSGNAVYIPPTNGIMGRMNLPFIVSSGQAYYSFILKVTDVSTLTSASIPNFFAAFGDNVGSQSAALARAESYVVAKKSGGGYVLGIGKNKPAATNTFAYDSTVHNVGDVVFVVVSYDYTTTGHPASLWVNPATNTFGAATPPAATASTILGGDPSSPGIQSFMLGCFTNSPPACEVDEVRVGLNWGVVTGAPDINTQPANLITNAGNTATFSVKPVGGAPLFYQWIKGAINLSNGGNIAGSSSAVLSITSVTASDMNSYSVIVSNSYGSITSSVATLSVNDPFVNVPPSPQTLPPGSTAIFTVGAAGVAPLSYQWNKNGQNLSDGGNISGSSTAALTVADISFSDDGTYSVFVTNGLSAVAQSSGATLTITDPAITAQPQSVTNNYGTTATFQVGAVGLTALGYQWHQVGVGNLSDGGSISGSQSSILTITSVSYTNAGSYYVTVNDTGGPQDSSPASLTVIEPIITSEPLSVTNVTGTTATFNVGATGAPAITYLWSKNGTALNDAGNIAGSSSATLTVSTVSSGDAASYSVVVTDASGNSATSVSALLTVLTGPSIVSQPSSRTQVPGSRAVFAVGTSGTAPLSYQWFSNNVAVAGATAFADIVTNLQLGMSGSFSVVVSNSIGAATSSVAVLTVTPSIHLYNTNLVVVRVGDGAETPVFNGNSVFLDQFTTAGVYLNTVCIPDTGANALIDIGPDVNGATITGTALSRSMNGRYLVLSGYNTTAPYSGALSSSAASAVPRGIALLDSSAQYSLPVSDHTAYNATYFRGAASDGTNNFWGAGNTGGTYYFGFSAPATTIQATNFANLRSVDVFNGNLYAVSGSSSGIAIIDWNGLPTSAMVPNTLFVPGATPTDMAIDPNGTNVYLGTSIGIMNYQYSGGSWNFVETITGSAIRYLTVDFSGAVPVIYAMSSDSAYDRLLAVTDNGPSSTEVTIATAGVNQNFRGIRFGPDETPTVYISRSGTNAILSWYGAFSLQSSTNVTGPFNNVPSATSPYTNSLNAADQLYFRVQ